MNEQDRMAHQQEDRCPWWCVVHHEPGERPADRLHECSGLVVPVIARPRSAPPATVGEVREFVVIVSRKGDRAPTWIYVGDGEEQWLEVDVHTMSQVADVLREVTEDLA